MFHIPEQSRYIDHKLLDNTNSSLSQILPFGNASFDTNANNKIITQQLTTLCQLKDSVDHFNSFFYFYFSLSLSLSLSL